MGYRFQHLELTRPHSAGEIVTHADPGELALLNRVHDAFEVRDGVAASHLHRMAAVTGLLAERLGMSAGEVWMIRAAASLHDIGKLMVSATVLWKPGTLDQAERA